MEFLFSNGTSSTTRRNEGQGKIRECLIGWEGWAMWPLQHMGKLQGKLPELKIVRLHRSKTFLLHAPTFLVIYLILLDVYVKLLN